MLRDRAGIRVLAAAAKQWAGGSSDAEQRGLHSHAVSPEGSSHGTAEQHGFAPEG